MNTITLSTNAVPSTFFCYPLKGLAFIDNDTLYLEKELASRLLDKDSFDRLRALVEYHGEIYLLNDVECLSEVFLFQLYSQRFTSLVPAIADQLFSRSFRDALRRCLLD